jgi:hypothetical protein
VPVRNRFQNQPLNLAPAKIAIPITTGAKNAAMPISGFGKPNSAACSLSITDLQLINGLMSQAVAADGLAMTCRRSSVSPKLAIQPKTPVKIRVKGNTTAELSHLFGFAGIIEGRCEHTRIEGLVRFRF